VATGQLRIYLGAAPGVGKTYTMLGEAHRRRGRGTDVVVGFVQTHGRRATEAMIGDLERMRETFGLASVSLLERRPDVPIDDTLALVVRGRALPAADRRIVEAFAAQAAIALRQERLAAQAAAARPLAEADRMRTALLAAVSHDLRTPLASAKAAVTSLRSSEVSFDESDRAELLATADESLDRLARLVANLLDMSRLQAGALGMSVTPIGLEEAVPRALDELGEDARIVWVRIPEDLPAVRADPALLERILVNLVGNALRFSPAGRPPLLTASEHGGQVRLRVVDHGPGIPESARDHVFLPFQRLGDRDNHGGVGLGLALAGWGSAWPCPAGWPRRWAGRWRRRPPPAAGSPWCSPCPPTTATRMSGDPDTRCG
jgi:K+-sensing histidine kinase KdpD